MPENHTTLWVALPDGRAARVRVDVLSEAMPAPLEVEHAVRPDDGELARILRALARGEGRDVPPMDPGLPPVSHHAMERGKSRCGLDKAATERTAALALRNGLRIRETRGRLRHYLESLQYDHGTVPRIRGNHIFIFGREDCLVTILELPREYRRAAASAMIKREREGGSR